MENVALNYLKDCKRKDVYLCIGTDKLIFDCLGPMVGSILKENEDFNGYVYGTLDNPVNALSVEQAVKFIRRFHFGAKITVIDSAVGRADEIGKIKCFDRGLRPALGIGKQMKIVGDESIMGIVTEKDKLKNVAECKVKLSTIRTMAKEIVNLITEQPRPVSTGRRVNE